MAEFQAREADVKLEPDELIPTHWSLVARLKNWDDQESWREFFETYWRLIYGIAVKAGLTDMEAQDVVQETVLSVARKIKDFKADPDRGSFKSWLLHTTRWRIADQFRKRMPSSVDRSDSSTRTDPIEKIPDPAALVLESVWQDEWEENLKRAAFERVKAHATPQEFQIFDLCVVRNCSVNDVAKKLGIKIWKVYFAQKKVARLLQTEVKKLRTEAA
jgi:RNA polymerase sigma factor (sigma-70 family)